MAESGSRIATGEMIFVRYADDLVVGFEYQADAERIVRTATKLSYGVTERLVNRFV